MIINQIRNLSNFLKAFLIERKERSNKKTYPNHLNTNFQNKAIHRTTSTHHVKSFSLRKIKILLRNIDNRCKTLSISKSRSRRRGVNLQNSSQPPWMTLIQKKVNDERNKVSTYDNDNIKNFFYF